MPQIVPLNDVPSQVFSVQLGGQNCQLAVYQKSTGLFMDVSVDNVLIIAGVVAENLNRIVRSLYLGFLGDLAFNDTQGTADPSYPGLGTRYELLYFAASEL